VTSRFLLAAVLALIAAALVPAGVSAGGPPAKAIVVVLHAE
jgi:hypothetical protein